MKLIKDDGSYNCRQFVTLDKDKKVVNDKKGKPIIWTLIGTYCQSNYKNPLLCVDTFKSTQGVYNDKKREDVLLAFNQNKIQAVPESLI